MKCCLKLTLLPVMWFSIASRGTRQLSSARQTVWERCQGLEIKCWSKVNISLLLQSSQELIELLVLHCVFQIPLGKTRKSVRRYRKNRDMRNWLVYYDKNAEYIKVHKEKTWLNVWVCVILKWELVWLHKWPLNHVCAHSVHEIYLPG